MAVSDQSQKCGGTPLSRTRPKTTARRCSAFAWLTDGSPRSRAPTSLRGVATSVPTKRKRRGRPRRAHRAESSLLLAQAPDHEAHVRVTGEGSRLKDAL